MTALVRFRDGVLLREGSTRSVALLRIGLALLVWHRFADSLAPWGDNLAPDRMVLTASFFLSSTLMLIGLWTRVSTAWTALTLLVMYYWYSLHGEKDWFEHHTYLMTAAVTLLALTPCGRSYSVDRWLALRRGEAAPETGPLWAVPLLALQTSAVYFWGAYDKCDYAFLSGERMEHYLMSYYLGSDYPTVPGFHAAIMMVAIATVALEYTLSVGLFIRPLQRWLVPVGLLFHGVLWLFIPVKAFSALMWLLYLSYLDPDAVHEVLDKVQERR